MNILLIEPDYVLANIYARSIEDSENEVALAFDAQSAINELDKNNFDLVIMEIQLPEHNGLEIIHELRTYPEWRNLPVVIHTLVNPDTIKTDNKLLSRLGVIAYLYKPNTSLSELQAVINRVLVH